MNHPITDRNDLPFVGFDTETLFTKDYSVSDLGPQGYVNDPRFDCYLVSLDDPDFQWVGHPRDCPWEKLRGRSFVSANAGFDQAVLRRMIELGQAPAWVYPEEWVCSANLSVYCGYPRALAQTVAALFAHKVDKSIRNVDMKGETLDTMAPDLAARVKEYALADARWCRLVWEALAHEWPPLERRISDLTYKMGAFGLYCDRPAVEADIRVLEQAKAAAFEKIPWTKPRRVPVSPDLPETFDAAEEPETKWQLIEASPPLSPKALRAYCASVGIPAPSSLAKDSEECAEWEAKYGPDYPVVAAMRDYRRTNTFLEKYLTIHRRINAEGRMPYSLKYFGASTGRWSGDSGVNIQNLPKEPLYFDKDWSITLAKTGTFVEMRPRFTAAPGKKFIIADYAQIEARVTPWLAGDSATLDLVRSGMSVYDSHALQSGMWDGQGGSLKKVNKTLYALAKARVLGLGFGCGWLKFVTFAKAALKHEKGVFEQVFGAAVSSEQCGRFLQYLEKYDKTGANFRKWPKLTPLEQTIWVNSWLQVMDFREKNPRIVALWKKLDVDLKASVGGLYEIGLPSGRSLKYFDVASRGDGVLVHTTKGGPPSHAYGGLLTENCIGGDMEVMSEDRGWVPLRTVTAREKVWDGVEFVAHSGLAYRGRRGVVDCHGVAATPDHRFLTSGGWVRADRACKLPGIIGCYPGNEQTEVYPSPMEMGGLSRQTVRGSDRGRASWVRRAFEYLVRSMRLRGGDPQTREGTPDRVVLLPSLPSVSREPGQEANHTRIVAPPRARGLAFDETEVPGQKSCRLRQLWRAGDRRLRGVVSVFRGVLARYGCRMAPWYGPGQAGQQPRVFSGELSVGISPRERSEHPAVLRAGVGARRGTEEWDQEVHSVLSDTPGRAFFSGLLGHPRRDSDVYDIVNCGPRHQFAVRSPGAPTALIAHNCVQATARDVMAEALVRIEDAGIRVVAHIHDEIVVEVDEGFDGRRLVELMTISPSWAKTLPLGAEFEESTFYKK